MICAHKCMNIIGGGCEAISAMFGFISSLVSGRCADLPLWCVGCL